MATERESADEANRRHLRSYEHSGEVLVTELRPKLLRRARGRGLGPADAEDAVQETLCRLFAERPALVNAYAWLRRVLDRRCIDLQRREHVRRAWEAREAATSAQRLEPESAERFAAREAIERLPARLRELVVRRFFGDESAQSAATSAGYRGSGAKKLLSRALRALRLAIAGREEPPPRPRPTPRRRRPAGRSALSAPRRTRSS
jgi:RNA polymerase sigma factor (sigma-70 family)